MVRRFVEVAPSFEARVADGVGVETARAVFAQLFFSQNNLETSPFSKSELADALLAQRLRLAFFFLASSIFFWASRRLTIECKVNKMLKSTNIGKDHVD